MRVDPVRVARRYEIRLAARQVVVLNKTASVSKVSRELTSEVLEAFGSSLKYTKQASILSRLKKLWDLFQKAPEAWEKFKALLGVTSNSLRELPGKIKAWFKKAKDYLAYLGKTLMKDPKVRILIESSNRMPDIAKWLAKVLTKLPPAMRKAVEAITSKAHNMAAYIDEYVGQRAWIKPVSQMLSAALFAFIWFNVLEISWNLPFLIKGFTGMLSWTDILMSLPESGMGFILAVMFPLPLKIILKTIVPATVALRILWLIRHGIVEWKPGQEPKINLEAIPEQ